MTRRRGSSAPFRAGAVSGVSLVALAASATGCNNGGLPDPATSQGDTVVQLWQVFLWGAVFVTTLIWVLVAYAIITSVRRARATRAAGGDGVPRQSQYRTKLEIVYTTIPLLVVTALFAITIYGNNVLADGGASPDLTIDVIGFQWQWQFEYEGTNVVLNGTAETGPDLYLPVGATVLFKLEADDVIHSFWVPEFLEKKDLIPGVTTNSIQVKVTRPGTYVGRCAEYCGLNHWLMKFNVHAVPRDQFDAWLAGQRTTRGTGRVAITTRGTTR